MLEGIANLFEGINDGPANLKLPVANNQGFAGLLMQPGWKGSCSSQQVLLQHHDSHGTAAILSLSALAPASGAHVAGQQGQSHHTSGQRPFQVVAHHTQLQHPDMCSRQLAVLLHACLQPNTSTVLMGAGGRSCPTAACLAGCTLPCWLALYRVGSKLQLYAVQAQQQKQQQQAQPAMHLLLELQHEGFQSLGTGSCWLNQGPTLLLQLQPDTLWLLMPSTTQPVSAAAAPVTAATASAATMELQTTWQLLEVGLQLQDILQTLDHESISHLMLSRSAAEVPVLAADSHSPHSCGMVATQPWKVLNCQPLHNGLQLLLGIEVAVTGPDPVCRAPTEQQQQQQRLGLVVSLEVELASTDDGTADPGSGDAHHSMRVAYCYATGWTDLPVYAATMQDEEQQQQLVLLGSSAGALQLFSSSVHQRLAQATIWQQQEPEAQGLAGHPGLPTKNASLLSTGQVLGPVQDMCGLPRVLAGGALHTNAWAVLHSTISSTSATAAGRAVTLMVQHRGQLHSIAQVQGAAALIAPSNSTTLGLLCTRQQQEQHASQQLLEAEGSAMQLAALIVLDQQAVLEANITTSLPCYAKIDNSNMPAFPASMLGLVQQAPQSYQQQCKAVAAGDQAGLDTTAAAAAATANELRGLQAMLTGLELHWQQEFLDLAALHHKLKQGSMKGASAHRLLCQLAADTVRRSSIRQHISPLSHLDASASVAAYQMGRQILQQQLREQQVHLMSLTGPHSERKLQLQLELISHSVQLLPDVLQVKVSMKPFLQMASTTSQRGQQQQWEQHANDFPASSSDSSLSLGCCSSWWGPLLQPCHAELLIWHADVSPVSSQSCWHWDIMTGVITVEGGVSKRALLQLAMMQSAFAADKNSSKAEHQGATAAEAAGTATEDNYVGVATVIAATLSAGMARPSANRSLSSSTSNHNGPVAPSSTGGHAVLSAAVVVSACCSQQAIVQVEFRTPGGSEAWPLSDHRAAAASHSAKDAVLLRSQLLEPAAALLHLPPVSVSMQQLLLCRRTAVEATGAPVVGEASTLHAGAQVPHAAGGPHTPVHDTLKHQAGSWQVTPDAAVGGDGDLPPIPTGFTDMDVIPPTPCDDDDGDIHAVYNGHQQDMVIADSEAEEDAIAPAPAVVIPVAAMAAVAAVDAPVCHAAPDAALNQCLGQQHVQQQWQQPLHTRHQRLLLLQGPSAVLQHMPAVLVQQLSFTVTAVVAETASSRAVDQKAQLSRLAASVNQLGQGEKRPVLVELQPPADDVHGQRNDSAVELVWFSSELLHAKLSAISSDRLDVLQHLLLLAIQGMPGHQEVTCEPSPLSTCRHATFLAATDALVEAVQLQCKVAEESLQQLHQCLEQQSTHNVNTAAGAASIDKQPTVSKGWAAVRGVALGVSPVETYNGGILLVDGMSASLADCWVAVHGSQGDVDFAMSQLADSS